MLHDQHTSSGIAQRFLKFLQNSGGAAEIFTKGGRILNIKAEKRQGESIIERKP